MMATYYNNVDKSEGRRSRLSCCGDFYTNATGAIPNGQWTPREENGISNYPPECGQSPEAFIKNYKQELTKYNESTSEEEKELMRQFLLHSVLPHMEEVLEANGFGSPEILKVLPNLCSLNDSLINRYALYMVLNVLIKRPCESDEKIQTFIFEIEDKLRNSIVSEGAIFDAEPLENQGLRAYVYSRVLIMVVVIIKQGKMRAAAWNNLESVVRLHKKLYGLNDQSPFREKKEPRYAVRCIHQSIETLKSKEEKRFFCFLKWLHESYNQGNAVERDKFLKEYITKVTTSRAGWFDFHVVVSCLEPKIHETPKVVDILLSIVEKYLNARKSKNPLHWFKWSDEAKWQTGLHLGCVLETIVMKNKDDVTRKVACGSLCLYVDELKDRDSKDSIEKLFIEQSLERCCFGPPKTVVPMMVSILKSRKEESITVLSSMKYLGSLRYRKEMDPLSHQLLCKDSVTGKAFFKVNFRGEKSITKILAISDDEQRGVDNGPSEAYQDLIKEAYFLRRLNVCPHPNILRVFAFDTTTKPYHIITEYAEKGTLLHYLQNARSDINPLPKPTVLLEMLFGIIEGLIALNERNLVHQGVMSKNILVTMDRTCKLTGFEALQEMHFNPQSKVYEYISREDETSIRHAAPEVLTDGQYSEKSMVFSFGRLLFEVFTYGNTPFNWLKDSEIEKIRSLVLKGGTLPQERCIPFLVWEIIEDCQQHNVAKRPNLAKLKYSLEEALSKFESSADDDRAPTEYPDLTHQDTLHSNLSSCYAMDKAEHSKVLGIFGFQTLADDRPEMQNIRGISQIREKVDKEFEESTLKLENLHNDHIVKVLGITDYSPTHSAIYTENTERGNLLQLVLSKQCNSVDLVRFLVQILHGLEFLHDRNILHCDIRAENMMVFYDKQQGLRVKIARLGRSRYLRTSLIELQMPEDAITRSPLEVIKHNIYSISSDVWSFALLCYELYEAYDNRDQPCQPIDCEPIKCKNELVLAYLESNNRPPKPQSMPDWLYIAVKQGLLCKPEERPPPILFRDCLTYRKPFESCLLSRWKTYHPDLIQQHNLDVEVEQPSLVEYDHVIPSCNHIPFDELHHISSVAVFLKHAYNYSPGNELTEDGDEELYEDLSLPATYVNIGRDVGERRVRDVTYDDVERRQLPPSQPTPPSSTSRPRVVPQPPPRPLKADHNQASLDRRPAPYPRRPSEPLQSNENRQQPLNDEVLYENIPFAYDVAREMAGQHDDAEERSWHSWRS